MFRLRKWILTIAATFLVCVALAQKECNTTDLIGEGCSETETCIAKTNVSESGYCSCLSGFKRVNQSTCKPTAASKNALPPSTSSLVEDSNTNRLAVAITIPLLVIALVICGIYVSRRYELYTWMRKKINQRSSNYDEVMIGQDLDDDDPPLR